ncbi:MAG TPA: glycoside hydrolase family 125 protein [Candidatus Baltobacteraceae bacterium]
MHYAQHRVWFAYDYWQGTGDISIFAQDESDAFDRILAVMRIEQHHNSRSAYRHAALANGGRGSRVAYTGMVWTGFRPSDDPARYHFNIPVNMLAVVVLHDLAQIERDVYRDESRAQKAEQLAGEIQNGIEKYGRTVVADIGVMYAYEVDGLGHRSLMDDANVPSLLSIPYIGYLPASDPVYQNTRRFILSDRNPYYYAGKYASGIGSPHTPHGYVWPLALVMQALTSTDSSETERVLGYIVASELGDHRLHESFDPDAPQTFTRADFAWPNALYTELVAKTASL